MNKGLSILVLAVVVSQAHAEKWKPLTDDGVHDPTGPALSVLQQPAEALASLPSDTAGNQVDWISAIEGGYITPRAELAGDREVEILDLDILMNEDGSLPRVTFPHKAHTRWLDCANCHDKLFESEAGATPVSMSKILEGEYCGVCHGAVAFPLTECNRCHNTPF